MTQYEEMTVQNSRAIEQLSSAIADLGGSASKILQGMTLDLNGDTTSRFRQIGAALEKLGMTVIPLES